MTLRPSKHSNKKKIEATMQKKRREIEKINQLPPYTLIISEGKKTEPNYVQGLIDLINAKYFEIYRKYSHLFPKEKRINVFATDKNTSSLLKFAQDYVKRPENRHYTRIWLVYDQDDFPYDDFNNKQFNICNYNDEDRKFFAAWSNEYIECIELWSILYFQELVVSVGQEQYQVILKDCFDFEKVLPNLYEILEEKGDVHEAIARAKKLYDENRNNPPSRMAPATRVHELVEELRG